jgi:hypothetical protein
MIYQRYNIYPKLSVSAIPLISFLLLASCSQNRAFYQASNAYADSSVPSLGKFDSCIIRDFSKIPGRYSYVPGNRFYGFSISLDSTGKFLQRSHSDMMPPRWVRYLKRKRGKWEYVDSRVQIRYRLKLKRCLLIPYEINHIVFLVPEKARHSFTEQLLRDSAVLNPYFRNMENKSHEWYEQAKYFPVFLPSGFMKINGYSASRKRRRVY